MNGLGHSATARDHAADRRYLKCPYGKVIILFMVINNAATDEF